MNIFFSRPSLLTGLLVFGLAFPGFSEHASPPENRRELPLKQPFIIAPQELTLQDCLAIALRENRTINQTRAKIKAAKAKKDQVMATQLPGANLLVQDTTYNVAPSSSADANQDIQRLTISDTFSPFGRFKSQRRAIEATIRAANGDNQRTEIEIAFQVTRTFYDLLLAERLVKVASESVDQLQFHRNNTALLVEAGSAPRFDLIRAEVQLSSVKPALIKATHALSTYRADLLNLLGLDPTASPKIIGFFPENVPEDLPLNEEEALNIAFQQRPDLKAAQATAEAAKHNLQASQKSLQPSIQLAQIIEKNRGAKAPLGAYRNNRTTQLGLVFPFFDSGLAKAQTREASANLEQAQLANEAAISTMHVEIRKAISALTESFEVLASQEKNVEQAQEALNIAEKAYQTGAKTSLDVLDAQLALTQARTLEFQALHDRAVALAQFERSLGLMIGHYTPTMEDTPAIE